MAGSRGNSRNRKERLGSQVREVLAKCLLLEVKDPRLHAISITDVELSGDLGHAKVYYYCYQSQGVDLESLAQALQRASGFLRRRLGQEIRARVTPELAFYYDPSIEQGAYMEQVIARALAEDQVKAQSPSLESDTPSNSVLTQDINEN